MKQSFAFAIAGVIIALIAVVTVNNESSFVLIVPFLLVGAVVASVISGRRLYGKNSLKGIAIPLVPLIFCTIVSVFLFKELIMN